MRESARSLCVSFSALLHVGSCNLTRSWGTLSAQHCSWWVPLTVKNECKTKPGNIENQRKAHRPNRTESLDVNAMSNPNFFFFLFLTKFLSKNLHTRLLLWSRASRMRGWLRHLRDASIGRWSFPASALAVVDGWDLALERVDFVRSVRESRGVRGRALTRDRCGRKLPSRTRQCWRAYHRFMKTVYRDLSRTVLQWGSAVVVLHVSRRASCFQKLLPMRLCGGRAPLSKMPKSVPRLQVPRVAATLAMCLRQRGPRRLQGVHRRLKRCCGFNRSVLSQWGSAVVVPRFASRSGWSVCLAFNGVCRFPHTVLLQRGSAVVGPASRLEDAQGYVAASLALCCPTGVLQWWCSAGSDAVECAVDSGGSNKTIYRVFTRARAHCSQLVSVTLLMHPVTAPPVLPPLEPCPDADTSAESVNMRRIERCLLRSFAG